MCVCVCACVRASVKKEKKKEKDYKLLVGEGWFITSESSKNTISNVIKYIHPYLHINITK